MSMFSTRRTSGWALDNMLGHNSNESPRVAIKDENCIIMLAKGKEEYTHKEKE